MVRVGKVGRFGFIEQSGELFGQSSRVSEDQGGAIALNAPSYPLDQGFPDLGWRGLGSHGLRSFHL